MSSGGGSVTVGYRYHASVHLIVTRGPVDAVTELIFAERSAWSGNVTASGQIVVDKPELFGGDEREGGVKGIVDVMMGELTQSANAHLEAKINGPVPAYRRLLSLVFRDYSRGFLWAAMNPYFKAPWVRYRRILANWKNNTPWQPGLAVIGADMNPAHIIYQVMTDENIGGIGYDVSEMDESSYLAAAQTLYDEGFGLSTIWRPSDSSSEEFIDDVLRHVAGVRRLDMRTGKHQIKLIRQDYDVNQIPLFDESNVVSVEQFETAAPGETVNEIIVEWKDSNENVRSTTAHSIAGIETAGKIISKKIEYPMVRNSTLAGTVLQREVMTSASYLATLKITTNRAAWDLYEGDVLKLNWPRLKISNRVFRITSINKGNLTKGEIVIEATEDVFKDPTASIVGQGESAWEDTTLDAVPASAIKTVETPYWDIATTVSAADQAYLNPDYAFFQLLAERANGVSTSFDLWYSPNTGSGDAELAASAQSFVPTAELVSALPYDVVDVTVSVTSDVDLDLVEIGNYAYIDNEVVGVLNVDIVTNEVTLQRAILDSIPASHATGAKIWFCDQGQAADPTQRTSGETAYYRAAVRSNGGILPMETATPYGITSANRASRPYPPGNVKINGEYAPASVTGDVVVTWSHRDKVQQTATYTAYTAGNIGPEPGVTYTVRVYSGLTLLRTYAGITANTWTYPPADALADGNVTPLRITLESEVSGLTSLYKHDFTVTRS